MAHPPWHLSGELLVAWVARSKLRATGGGGAGSSSRAARLPLGLAPLPGPAAVVAVSYADSPVGPYVELSIAEPARLGLRPGYCVTTSVVSVPECRVDYRLNWGVRADVGALLWELDPVSGVRTLTWLDRGVSVSGRPSAVRLPAWLPVRSVQRRSDGAVVVPRRMRGWISPARCVVEVPDGDGLSWAAGAHLGGVVTGMRMVVDPARHPAGLLSSLRAPLQAPAPGGGLTASVASEPAPAATRVVVPRAYGSVG